MSADVPFSTEIGTAVPADDDGEFRRLVQSRPYATDWQPGPTPVFGDVLPSDDDDATALEEDLRILRAACRGK